MTELVLGTAQFGDAYGVTNALGRLTDTEVAGVLDGAQAGGITAFDTAADYGDSQERLGSLAAPESRFITKFSLREGIPNRDSIYGGAMAALRTDRLAGVLFHRPTDLDDERATLAVRLLREGRERGELERVGVSVYDSVDLTRALAVFPDLDLVQVPGSIIDRRMLDDPQLARIRDRGGHVHVRSAFLQGVLLSPLDSLPKFFEPLRSTLARLQEIAGGGGVLGLALRALRDDPVVNGVIVGATSAGELATVVEEWRRPLAAAWPLDVHIPTAILDPRMWPRMSDAS